MLPDTSATNPSSTSGLAQACCVATLWALLSWAPWRKVRHALGLGVAEQGPWAARLQHLQGYAASMPEWEPMGRSVVGSAVHPQGPELQAGVHG